MRLRLLGAAIGVALGVMSVGLTPALGGNPDKPAPPGQEKTPPGQEAKAEGLPEKSIPPGQLDKETAEPAPSAGEAAPGDEAPSSHPKPHASKSSGLAQEVHPKAETAPAKPAKAEHPKSHTVHGNSAVAHTHVIICHRTGSRSNPYVVINISMSAWLHGHATHPERNGHNDILLKMGAAPGEKLPRSACGTAGSPNTPGPPAVNTTPTAGTPRQTSGTPSATPSGKPADPSAPPAPVVPPAHPKGKSGGSDEGVAAYAEAAARGELPFTGLPLWLAVFAGWVLLGAGLAIRKASWAPGEAEAERVRPDRRR